MPRRRMRWRGSLRAPRASIFVLHDGMGLVAKRLEHIPNSDPPADWTRTPPPSPPKGTNGKTSPAPTPARLTPDLTDLIRQTRH